HDSSLPTFSGKTTFVSSMTSSPYLIYSVNGLSSSKSSVEGTGYESPDSFDISLVSFEQATTTINIKMTKNKVFLHNKFCKYKLILIFCSIVHYNYENGNTF